MAQRPWAVSGQQLSTVLSTLVLPHGVYTENVPNAFEPSDDCVAVLP